MAVEAGAGDDVPEREEWSGKVILVTRPSLDNTLNTRPSLDNILNTRLLLVDIQDGHGSLHVYC